MPRALIFDCDGVLSDTERDGHLPAFNATFDHFGLRAHWSHADYARVLAVGGGKERLGTLLTPAFVAQQGIPSDPAAQRELVAQWHAEKTARYTAIVRSGALPARPGVARLAGQAHEAGWLLAVASTSAVASVRAVLQHVVGTELAQQFTVFAGDVVPRKKPAPDIYQLALRSLDVTPADAVVVEDSALGLAAALGAGLTTIVTPSTYTTDEDFTGAALVVDTLGDRPDRPATVLTNPHGLVVDGEVSAHALDALLSTASTSPHPEGDQ